MSETRATDSVRATLEGARRLRDKVRDRIWQEKQQRREEGRKPNYTREDLVEEARISIDTLKRLLGRKVKVRRDSADAIARFLGMDLADIIDPNRSQRPSDFYVERAPLESQCYQEVCSQQSTLIRIKAPHRMGKTWFAEHVLNQLEEQRYRTVVLNFRYDGSRAVFNDLQTFLKWFCNRVGDSLELADQLEEKWQDALDSNSNCTNYFQSCVLASIDQPLVLVLDDIDFVFEQGEIADDFCRLLRSWYDRGRRVRSGSWQNLRLIIIHSTDVYGALDINYSPLANVGMVFPLRKFYLNEVTTLVQQYQLDWQTSEVEQITVLTGGNPYLIHEALNYLMLHPEISLKQFLHNAATGIEPYHNYLGELLSTLQQNSNLAVTFREVVQSTTPIRVESAHQFQLYSMGLIEIEERGVLPSCELYQQYFCDRL